MLLSCSAPAWSELPPGASPRDPDGALVGPVLVQELRGDWARRGLIQARAQNQALADAVDSVFRDASEIASAATTPKAFRDALGPLVVRPRETWLALGALDEGGEPAAQVELVTSGERPGIVRVLVDRKSGRARAVVWVPLEPLPFAMKVSAGHSIEGDTYEFAIDRAGRLHFVRITPTTWKADMTRDRLLRPDERARLVTLFERDRIFGVVSQDWKRHPLVPDQGYYVLDLERAVRTTYAQLGMAIGSRDKRDADEQRMFRLMALLGSIVGVEVR